MFSLGVIVFNLFHASTFIILLNECRQGPNQTQMAKYGTFDLISLPHWRGTILAGSVFQ